MSRPHLLALSGSLRRNSFSTGLLRALAAAVAEKVELTLHPLDAVPLYNQDLDTAEPPPAVQALRNAIAAADGLVIATPEYNHGIPGMLKNALDWASRPYGKSTMTGKVAFTLTSSPGEIGGARAHAQLNETLASIAVRVVLRPQACVTSVGTKLVDGRIVHEPTLAFLRQGLDDLLRDIVTPNVADRESA